MKKSIVFALLLAGTASFAQRFDIGIKAGANISQVVMDWLSIPRQLRYLAWALLALAVAYLMLKAFRRT